MNTREEVSATAVKDGAKKFSQMLEKAIWDLTEKLSETKGTYADLCRLIALKQELDQVEGEETIRIVDVRWREADETESDTER